MTEHLPNNYYNDNRYTQFRDIFLFLQAHPELHTTDSDTSCDTTIQSDSINDNTDDEYFTDDDSIQSYKDYYIEDDN